MVKNWNKYIFLLGFALFICLSASSQVKIGDNHKTINAGSLLELESTNKGLMFPRVALNDDLSKWELNGNDTMPGMVVYNTNDVVNNKGLYCWYDGKWNHLSSGGIGAEFDTLSFNTETRILYDDADSVVIPSGRVSVVDSVGVINQLVDNASVNEGDIFYVSGNGLFIRNNNSNATTIADAFIYVPAMPKPGKILYANYDAVKMVHNSDSFALAVNDSFYHEPDEPKILNVPPPSLADNNGYYAFAVPNEWANPRIFLKVKNSSDGGFYKLNNCWTVTREMEFEGILYQVWTLDVPMRESVMDIVNSKAQFMIE